MQERLAYYVYLLLDPRDGRIFYVGKGKGNRVFAHANDALDDEHVRDELDHIRSIRGAGLKVGYEFLGFRMTEGTAFDVEAAAIQLLGLDGLTDLVAGKYAATTGRMPVDVAISLIDAPPAPEITEPTLLIKIPKLWYPSISAQELYEATAGWWAIKNRTRRNNARYAFCVVNSVIREVYRINSWRQRQEGDRDWEDDSGKNPRWGFDGEIAKEMTHYRNHSIKHLYKKGDANEIRYFNCD
ncbi:MAG: hypothetical protein M1305_06450 [Candidatus Marsarchaeota archaeon]|nr:hypothetical protein [Candidatus Marsarchaeota archaeon]